MSRKYSLLVVSVLVGVAGLLPSVAAANTVW